MAFLQSNTSRKIIFGTADLPGSFGAQPEFGVKFVETVTRNHIDEWPLTRDWTSGGTL
jgi:hypothetical protein